MPEDPTPYPHVVARVYTAMRLIQALLGVKTVYRLTLRALQGFTQNLHDLAFPSLPVPNYTTLCRRAKTLDVELPILRDNEPIARPDSARAEQIDVIGGDSAYDTKPCYAAIAAQQCCSFSIPLRAGAAHWAADTPGTAWHNGAVDVITRDGRREWKKDGGHHRQSLAENTMYRFKTLTGNCLWARHIDSQATNVAILRRHNQPHADLARPQSVRIA
ncbi:MAG: hypothetical protein E5299_00214 [Burkholderia gladioli]|nr:MAG: hypothetical protein E5299_00214 [Burkholderia gladioli]